MIIESESQGGLSKKGLALLLCSRLLLFAFFQAIFAIILGSWIASQKYWLLAATLTNLVSFTLLVVLYRREGMKYLSIFNFHKEYWVKDLLISIPLAVLGLVLILAPSMFLNTWLWSDPNYYHKILFQPIPALLGYILMVLFPVTIAFAELATYFGYIMPKLQKKLRSSWTAVLLPVLFLSIQHCTLPLVFDATFILFRGIMYLPLAFMIGIAIWKRPSLFPYLVIFHGIMDALAASMLLAEINKI